MSNRRERRRARAAPTVDACDGGPLVTLGFTKVSPERIASKPPGLEEDPNGKRARDLYQPQAGTASDMARDGAPCVTFTRAEDNAERAACHATLSDPRGESPMPHFRAEPSADVRIHDRAEIPACRARTPRGLVDLVREQLRSAGVARSAATTLGRSGEVAQVVEHAAENRGVAGSNPALAIA